ncbi:CdaR family protein [Dysosmobacter sp.]
MKSKVSKRKAFYIALATLVAVIIWIYVDMTGSPDGTALVMTKEFKEIPIEYLAEDTVLADRGLMLLEDGTDTTVDVTLEGTRWNLAKVDRDDILIQADLSNVTATGQQNISNTTGFTTRGLAQIVKFTEIKPFTSTVNIGELYSKTVDVRYEIIGNVAEGYSAGELQLSNTSVEIRGQEEMLDQVSYAKVSLDIGPDAVSTVSQLLPFQYYDENDQPLSSSGIHSSVDQVQVTLPVNVTKELALTMDFHEVPGARLSNVNVDINPKSITVSGDAEQLRDVDSLVLSEFDLINLDSSTIYNYVIPVPEGCENLSGITQATLRLSFKDMTTAEVTTDRIRYENLAMDGKHVELLTLEMNVQIFGTSVDVSRITGDNIMVVADLTDFNNAVGSYTVPARVLIDSGGDIGIAGTYQVRVDISESREEPTEEPAEESPPAE